MKSGQTPVDDLLNKAWWLAVMSLTAASGVGGLLLAYRGTFELISGAMRGGVVDLLFAVPLASAAYLLAAHRVDLVCE